MTKRLALLLIGPLFAAISCLLGAVPAHAATVPGLHVTALDVQDSSDGTGPFDADDEAGNDSSAKNGICRSFDDASWTLGYVTGLDDPADPISEATVELTVTLDCDPKEARIATENMAWAEDPKVTYTYADGTTSEARDPSRAIVRQTWVGRRTLRGRSSDDRVPGAGQLSVDMRLQDAICGKTYRPHASLRVVGSDIRRDIDLTPVKASSALKLDLFYQMGASESARNVTYVNPGGTGDASFSRLDTDPAARPLAGRCYASAIGLVIHDDSSAKGLKGCSLPSGPVTFDVQTNVTLDGKDSTTGNDYKYLLWDARANDNNFIQSDSLHGRTMHYTSSQYAWEANVPYNSYGTANPHACRTWADRPIWSFEEDEATPGLLHVTVTPPASGWADPDNPTFPRFHNWTSDATDTGTNTEFPDRQFLAVGVLQHYAAFPRTADATHDIRINSHVVTDSFRASSRSGAEQTQTKTPTWYKTIGASVTIYAPGTYTSWNYPGGQLVRWPSYWSAGDASIARGSNLWQSTTGSYDGTRDVIAFDCLTTIDTGNATIVDQGTMGEVQRHVRVGNNGEYADQRYLYAAKPDGTGWRNLDEQRSTHITDLVYYKTYADLQASGKVCVGFLREVRNADILAYRDMGMGGVTVRATGEPGNVIAMTHESDIWVTGQEAPGSRVDHQNADGSYGLVHDGNVAGKLSVFDGYAEQPYAGNNIANYERALYVNGVKVGGHTGGNVSGNSVLILGDKASVTIGVADNDASGAPKQVFDLDAGERDVTFVASPALASYAAGGETGDRGLTDDLTMTVTIPKGLTYEAGTASRAPMSVMDNADGTTTLAFDYKDAPVGELMEAVTLKAYIGNPGAEDDAQNNQQFTATAHVFSRMDPSNAAAHDSSTSFRVVRLAALSVSKRVSREHDNPNSSFDWVLRVSNTSETDTHHAAVADLLPFTGDGRGTLVMGRAPRLASVTVDATYAPRTAASMRRLSSVLSTVSGRFGADWARSAVASRPADGMLPGARHMAAPASGDVMAFDTSGADASGVYLALGTLCAHEYVTVTLHMDYPGAGELAGSTMTNQYAEGSDDQPADVDSNVVTHAVEQTGVSVEKRWDDDGGTHRPGSVTAEVTGTDGSSRDVALDAAHDWKSSLTLPSFDASGERIGYSVTEPARSDFYHDGAVSGSVADGFVIDNVSDSFRLTVSKACSGDGADPDAAFSMRATFTGADGVARVEEFSLKTGQSWTSKEYFAGTRWTLEESSMPAGWHYVSGQLSGVLDADAATTVSNEFRGGRVSVTKAVDDPTGRAGGTFHATLSTMDPDGRSSSESFNIRAGQTWTSRVYPEGTRFTVTEASDPAWSEEGSVGKSGTIAFGQASPVTLRNRFRAGRVSITKASQGGYDDGGRFPIIVTFTEPDGRRVSESGTFSVGGTWTSAWHPAGTTFSVVEGAGADGWEHVSTDPEFGTLADQLTARVVVTNRHTGWATLSKATAPSW